MTTMSDTTMTDTAVWPPVPGAAVPRPTRPVRVDVGALSDVGKVRARNEDHYLVARFGRSLEVVLTNMPAGEVPARAEDGGYAFLVADGMGGHAGGDEASRLAIRSCVQLVLAVPDWILRINDDVAEEVMRRAAERYREVNAALAARASSEPRLCGMGTTLTMAWGLGDELFLAHVGDSRAYVHRRATLYRVTRDHTLAQAMAEDGLIGEEEAATHRLRHVLTRCLGRDDEAARPEIQRLRLADGDALLLCSDGLTEMVPEDKIAEVLAGGLAAQDACRRLVELALQGGGKDNVTVITARYRFPPPDEGSPG
jgi:protein phosphatase